MKNESKKNQEQRKVGEYRKTAELGIYKDFLPDAVVTAGFIFEKINFNKPFRAVVEYDPDKPKMAIEVYEVN